MASQRHNFLAIDLGASNGRVVRGRLDGGLFQFTIVHRFEHQIVETHGRIHWDWPAILREIHTGLARAAAACTGEPIDAVSCSSWAQDFGLLDIAGKLFYPPVSYRDHRTRNMPQSFAEVISPDDLLARVGSGCSPVTALCQLRAMSQTEPEELDRAATLLFVADLVHHDLCGSRATDWTMATASQCRNLRTGQWDVQLLDRLGIPHHYLPPIIETPAAVGRMLAPNPIHPQLAGVPVIAGAGHDTGAAVAAIEPLKHGDLFLSLGTWAMLGCCVDPPVMPERPAERGFSLLGLAGSRWGLFRGGTGLWLLQQCCRQWEAQGLMIDLARLIDQAAATPPRGSFNPCDPRFDAPSDLLAEIRAVSLAAGFAAPETPAEFARVMFDSLATCYAQAAKDLQSVTHSAATTLRMINGGSRNELLCRLIEQASGLTVHAGPAEATAIGNILIQARAAGAIASDGTAIPIQIRTGQ